MFANDNLRGGFPVQAFAGDEWRRSSFADRGLNRGNA
jgi:hypothetical protein